MKRYTYVNPAECEAAGLDLDAVESLARRLTRLGREAEEMGLQIFGGHQGGTGDLRARDAQGNGLRLIVSDLGGNAWQGGVGDYELDADDLRREVE